MKQFIVILFSLVLASKGEGTDRSADNSSKEALKTLGVAYSGAAGTALAKADVALCGSMITPAHLKGDVGEAFMGKLYLKTLVSRANHKWELVSPRYGRQGIDGVFMAFDKNGIPRQLLVAEAKYGSSQLGMTFDGRQMSQPWAAKRLAALGTRYSLVSKTPIQQVKQPFRGEHIKYQLAVEFEDGRKGIFWKRGAQDTWKYDGPEGTLGKAQSKASMIGKCLDNAGKGKFPYRSRLFRFGLDGDELNVSIGDTSKMLPSGRVPIEQTFKITLSGLKRQEYVAAIHDEIARTLRKKFPQMSQEDVLLQAKKLTEGAKTIQEMVENSNRNLTKSVAYSSLNGAAIGSIIAGSIDVAMQMALNGDVDLSMTCKQMVLGGAGGGLGTLAGQGSVIFLTKSQLGYGSMQHIATSLGLPTASSAATLTGSFVGGSVASIVFAYGGLAFDMYEWKDANRQAIAGIAGTSAGTAAVGGTMVLISTYGTASTGVAISSLSGAASSSATMAWVGGGSVAAGGGGTAAGAMILTAGTAIVVIAATGAVMYGFHLYDEKQDDTRIAMTMNSLLHDDNHMDHIAGHALSIIY